MSDTTEDTGYSPLLASMLKVDPSKVGSISLSSLGRQAMGADTEAYQAAKAEVDAAREAMKAALTERKNRIDPTMLALAQGFLAPTRTGSFGESLGTAAGAYSKAQEGEADRAAQLARMRYELANSALGEEKQAAQLGLSVASKLTPKMTAYQQQVQSEGINPNSPEGVARVKELLAVDKATPEMKLFAAQTGVPLTDPAFSAKFKQYEETKGLRDIATRENLDLANPEHLARAQKIAQRDSFAKDNPELHKVLQRFGGDALNPQDLARAQREMQSDVGLERQSKQSTIAAQNAQTKRTQQEIDEHVRQGDFGAVAAKASEVGVPIDPRSSYAGLNKIEAAKKREADLKESNKYLTEKVTPYLQEADKDIVDLQRALALNKQISTGVTYGLPGVGGVAKVLSGDRAKINEFDSLSSMAAKQNRIPGDHNISNADVRFMQLGTFSSDKEPSTNDILIRFQLEQRKRDRDYNDYLTKYAAVNGAITPHAQEQWRRYLNANPITVRDAKGAPQINPSRISFEQYFSMPRVRVNPRGEEQQ